MRSSGSTGTRDIYHGNKIQFSRTEGTVLLHFASRRFLRLAWSAAGEALSTRFVFGVNSFFVDPSFSFGLCFFSLLFLFRGAWSFRRPELSASPVLVGAAVWRSVPKGRRKLRPTPHLVKVFCLARFVFSSCPQYVQNVSTFMLDFTAHKRSYSRCTRA